MGDEFNFEEAMQANWLNDTSRFTDKHLQTLSEVSKQHFLDVQLEEEVDHKGRVHDKNGASLRERNKANARNYRDRKKTSIEGMKRQIEHLHQENAVLRSQKYCRWCNRNLLPNVLLPPQTLQKVEHTLHAGCQHGESEMELQFQKPNLASRVVKQKNPKIWIALGILLLVLGLTMHGLNGDKSYISKIEVEKEEMRRWVAMAEEKEKAEYFEVSMRMKEESRKAESKMGISVQFTEGGEGEGEGKGERVSLNKELLMVIQAELDDIGVYL